MNIRSVLSCSSIVAASFVCLPVASYAAFTACDAGTPDASNDVTANYGCQLVGANDSELVVNAMGGMFSVDTWKQLEKDEEDDIPSGSGLLQTVGDRKSGTWSVAQSVFDTYEDVMLVFKGGNQAVPDTAVGYLISGTPDILAGAYKSPFFDLGDDYTNDANRKQISHISLYAANPVPIPAAAWLFGSALVGLVGISRKRKVA